MIDTAITIVPANEASWEDLQAVLCTRGDASRCQCQRYKMQPGVRSHVLPSSSRVTGGAGALEGYPMITQPGQEVARGNSTSAVAASSAPPGSRRSATRPAGGS